MSMSLAIRIICILSCENPSVRRTQPGPHETDFITAIGEARCIAIRAGSRPHRSIPIWAVVVERRIFVRSWSLKPRSWYRTLRVEPHGLVRIGHREARFRAVHTRSARLKAAVDRAYLAKYGRPVEIRFARDMARAKSKATTTELVLDELR